MAGIETRFRFGEIRDLADNIPSIVPAVERRLDDIGLAMADKGADLVRSKMRKATGRGQRSVGVRVTGRQFAFGSPLIHVLVMDQGRRAGAPLPPKGALLPWMRRKGIPERDEYPIRRAIAKRGIKGDHTFAQVRGVLQPEVAQRLGDVELDIMAAMLDGVDH